MMATWPLLALAFSFCGSVIIGYNQWARVDGRKLVVLRVLGILPLSLLSLLFLEWPTDWKFYVTAAAMVGRRARGRVRSVPHGDRTVPQTWRVGRTDRMLGRPSNFEEDSPCVIACSRSS